MDYINNSNFIGGFAGSLRDSHCGLDPHTTETESLNVSDCTLQLEFNSFLLTMPLMEKSLYQKVYGLPLVKESFSLIIKMVVRSTIAVMILSGS